MGRGYGAHGVAAAVGGLAIAVPALYTQVSGIMPSKPGLAWVMPLWTGLLVAVLIWGLYRLWRRP